MVGSESLKSNNKLLRVLHKCKPQAQKAIVGGAPNEVINCLCEVALNILKGNVPLNKNQKNSLAKYKLALRSLAKKSTSQKKRRQILQRGGFLGAILGPLLGTILKPLAQSILG